MGAEIGAATDLRNEDPWPGLGEADPPADPALGPFPRAGFLHAWWRHLGTGRPVTVEVAETLLPLVVTGTTLRCAGDSDLTDYHSPLGSEVEEVGRALGVLVASGHRLDLDSLAEESAHRLVSGLASTGVEASIVPHQVAMVIEADGGDHLAFLDRKQRHEVRRKLRRYREAIGEIEVVTLWGEEGLERFATLHRRAPGAKGAFFDPARYRFFADLAVQPGWRVEVLQTEGRPVAALFAHGDDEGYYLYNSAYDPDLAELSPGIVLLATTIARLFATGVPRFDFLKGDEEYKVRLGARPRPLFRVATP